MRAVIISSLLVAWGIVLGGCATVTRGTSEPLAIQSEPEGARVELSSGETCITHCSFELQRKHDIGGPEILTYCEMMQQYAEARGLPRRLILRVPVLTPLLSSYWVDLVTPVPSGIGHPLIEGLKNEVVCRENRIEQHIPIQKTPFKEGIRIALSEEKKGPGVIGS